MLSKINLNKEFVTKEGLLKHLDDITIYRMYLDGEDVSLRGNMNSPLREDKRPSFGFYMGESNEVCFNDFVLGKGDCIKFVQLKFGLSFFEALSKIAIDAGLENEFIIKNTFKTNVNTHGFPSRDKIIENLNTVKLRKKKRDWQIHDIQYWRQFGISINTLEKYKVEPVSHVFIYDKIITCDKHAYCFKEFKDGIETYKIYQPFNEMYKWLNNHNDSIWQGWEQLPNNKNIRQYDGKTLIITKSLKDVMSIYEVTGIPAISLQTESTKPKQHIIDMLKDRFENIFILYDNDFDKEVNWGYEFGKKIADEFGMIQILIPTESKSKDFSDLVKNHGEEKAKKFLLTMIDLPF